MAALYSKRRKNLRGGRRKRSNRKRKSGRNNMNGGSVLPLTKTTVKAKFTGSQRFYRPCGHLLEGPPNLTQAERSAAYRECLKNAVSWRDLEKEDLETEIERQWNELSKEQQMLFINADSEAEREYLLFNDIYFSINTEQWNGFTDQQKMVFISTVSNKDRQRTPFQVIVHDYLTFISKMGIIENSTIMKNAAMWNAMTEENKKIFMKQHKFNDHRFNYETMTFDEEWFYNLSPGRQCILNSYVAKGDDTAIQYLSSPVGEKYLDTEEMEDKLSRIRRL
jgi:hypothetical protein